MSVTTQWRQIPSFPEYEINIKEDIRRIDTKEPAHPWNADQTLYFLKNNGVTWGASGASLVREAFPDYFVSTFNLPIVKPADKQDVLPVFLEPVADTQSEENLT